MVSPTETSGARDDIRVRYALALLAVMGAVAIRWALTPWLEGHAPFVLFTVSVMLAARAGGVGPGLFATFLGAVVGIYFFIRPYHSFYVTTLGDGANLALFVAIGIGISLLNGQLRRALYASITARKQYQTLTEAVPHVVWTALPDGSSDYLNPRWEQYTGISSAVGLNWGWLDAVHPDDRERVRETWQAAAGGADFHTELRLRRRDGAYRWFDVHAVPLRDSAGRIVKWFGSNTDVDDARQSTAALRVERERLERIFATAPAVICSFLTRPDGSVSFPYASLSIRDIYGIEPQALARDGSVIFTLMPPEDAARVQMSIGESARTMSPWRDQFRVRNPLRGEIWVEGHSQPTALPDGSIEWHGFIADVTERHKMEQVLRGHTARLEELTQTLDLAHAIVRKLDGTITYWSEGAAILYGWGREETVGLRSHDLLRTEPPERLKEASAALLTTGRWEGELRHYRRDGTPVTVASHWALHRNNDGEPESVTEVNNDITAQKRVEGELRASEERLELAQAAGGIAAWDWDIGADVLHTSISYAQLYGLPGGSRGPTSQEWLQLIHPDDRARVREELQLALAGGAAYDTEFRLAAPPGSVRWILGKGQVHRDSAGRPVRMLGVNMDITDRKSAAEQLRALSASLISAQEEERRRISRELHDDLTQRLCALSISIGRLATRPSPAKPSELRGLQEDVVEAAQLTRHIAHELHPAILDELGIEQALRAHCEQVANREKIEIAFSSRDLPPVIPREIASCLYAITQESLLNVARHGQARHVTVDLQGTPQCVSLSVSDDGVGFAIGCAPTFGLGIVNMRERVRTVHGRFTVESQPGAGTRIAAEVPV